MTEAYAGAMNIATLELGSGSTAVTLAPARGGMATAFRVEGRDLFYLDPATLEDESKNVRGGSPVLFPSPGKLEGDHFAASGRAGALKQHGFARNLPWAVESRGSAEATLALSATPVTRESYPWDFCVKLRYAVSERTLRVEQEVSNEGDGAMPFGFGFHPYFAVPQAAKAAARIATGATRAWDNVARREIAFSGFDLTAPEVDVHLHDHGRAPITLALGGSLGEIEVRGSPEYTHWVVWTLQGKDFVCVEPWTCPGNALNTRDRVIVLEAGEKRTLWIEIALREIS